MNATVIPLLPRSGFTVRRSGELWELIHSGTYGRDVVLNTWPRDGHSEAFAHCHQLNGRAAANLLAAQR